MYSLAEKIRTRLLLDQPFFGTLAMHLQLVEDESIETAAVDNVQLIYAPKYLASLTSGQQETLFAHEISHIALGHPWRRDGRDMQAWNEACDYVINPMLVKVGFPAIAGWLLDPQYDGMNAEQVYAKRQAQKQPQPQQGKQKGQPSQDNGQAGTPKRSTGANQGDGSPTGSFSDPVPTEGVGTDQSTGAEPGSEQHWQTVMEQAQRVASAAGTMPGSASKEIARAKEPQVDWKSETKDFLVRNTPSDYAWSTPNRRFIAQNVYLPGILKENVGPLVIVVDSSGSTIPFLQIFADELTGIVSEVRPEKVYVLYVDTRVANVDEFMPGDEVKLNIRGFGGTYFQPAFDWVEQEQIQPVGLIYLTDLDCADAPKDPGYPVLWGVPEFCTKAVGFGQVVPIALYK